MFKFIDISTNNKDLDILNKYLSAASHRNVILKQDKLGRYYIYDFEYAKVYRKKAVVIDILDAQYFDEWASNEELIAINRILKSVGAYEYDIESEE